MIEKEGDLFNFDPGPGRILRCITTNSEVNRIGSLVMGAGIALQAKRLFPQLPKFLGTMVKQNGNHVYILENNGLASFPTKDSWRNNATLDLIRQSCQELYQQTNKTWDFVLLPRPGVGLGNLSWYQVKPILVEELPGEKYIVLNPVSR